MDKLVNFLTLVVIVCVITLGVYIDYTQTNRMDALQEQLQKQNETIILLNEEVGKQSNGEPITRIQMYDLVAGQVIQSVKGNQ